MAKKKKTKAKKKAAKRLMNKETQKNVGYWVFLVGVFVAIIAGLLTVDVIQPDVVWVLAILGIVVGLMNIKLKDEVPFLIATLVLMTAAGFFSASLTFIPYIGYVGELIGTILQYIIFFVAPAAIIVALKAVYHFGK